MDMEPPTKKTDTFGYTQGGQIYNYNDPYFKTPKGLYIMAECLLSLTQRDTSKCIFYDTHIIVSTYDTNINKIIYVKFNNVNLFGNTIQTNYVTDEEFARLFDD